jgi:hypothetical protein
MGSTLSRSCRRHPSDLASLRYIGYLCLGNYYTNSDSSQNECVPIWKATTTQRRSQLSLNSLLEVLVEWRHSITFDIVRTVLF